MVQFDKYKNMGNFNSIVLLKENIKNLDLWLNYNDLDDEKQIKKIIKYIKSEFNNYPEKIKSLKNFEDEFAIAIAQYDKLSEDRIEIIFYEDKKILCVRIKPVYDNVKKDFDYKIIDSIEILDENFGKIKDIL